MTRSTPRSHWDEGSERVVAILKSPNFDLYARAHGGRLPLRIDLLGPLGFRLTWSDRHLHGALAAGTVGRLINRSEAIGTPWLQTVLSWPRRRTASVVLAFFESEGHALALTRSLSPWVRDRAPLVIISCWLTDLVTKAPPLKIWLYRCIYRSVDRVVVYSSNQKDPLVEKLGLPPHRVAVVPYGIDLEGLAGIETFEDGGVVAVGRDLSRDWATLAAAVDGTGWQVELATRPSQLAGIDLPSEVRAHGYLPHDQYVELLTHAIVVVVPTEVCEYPAGQTVLLEAMALGKACVVTDTPALREYVEHEQTALLVPPHDPSALRQAVQRLLDDESLRRRLGAVAKAESTRRGGAEAMWETVAEVLNGAIDESGRARSRRVRS